MDSVTLKWLSVVLKWEGKRRTIQAKQDPRFFFFSRNRLYSCGPVATLVKRPLAGCAALFGSIYLAAGFTAWPPECENGLRRCKQPCSPDVPSHTSSSASNHTFLKFYTAPLLALISVTQVGFQRIGHPKTEILSVCYSSH